MVVSTVRSSQLAGMSSVRDDTVTGAAAAAAPLRSSFRMAGDSEVICLPLGCHRGSIWPYSGVPEGYPLRYLAEDRPACAGRATGYAARFLSNDKRGNDFVIEARNPDELRNRFRIEL